MHSCIYILASTVFTAVHGYTSYLWTIVDCAPDLPDLLTLMYGLQASLG